MNPEKESLVMKFLDNKWQRAESSVLKDDEREVPTNVRNFKNNHSSLSFSRKKKKAYIKGWIKSSHSLGLVYDIFNEATVRLSN